MNDRFKRYLEKRRRLKEHCLGSLIGGAVGDALGYEVEFDSLGAILSRYPEPGISDYALDERGLARISDDTQMSLFTLEGLTEALYNNASGYDSFVGYVRKAYLNWYATQTEPQRHIEGSALCDLPELWSRRAPGNTCLSALARLKENEEAEIHNNSKGCGGVMRIAPVSIFSAASGRLTAKEAGYVAGMVAKITHSHPMSTCASVVLALLLSWIFVVPPRPEDLDSEWFRLHVRIAFYEAKDVNFIPYEINALEQLCARALDLAESDLPDAECIRRLGEGWVAEETLAIALFSVMRYMHDFEKCIVCAVNHDGDSDSTGAVAGNIIGAMLGYKAIPEKYLKNLELVDTMKAMIDKLMPDR